MQPATGWSAQPANAARIQPTNSLPLPSVPPGPHRVAAADVSCLKVPASIPDAAADRYLTCVRNPLSNTKVVPCPRLFASP